MININKFVIIGYNLVTEEFLTGDNDIGEANPIDINDSVNHSFTAVNDTRKTTYLHDFEFADIFKFKMDSTVFMTMTMIPNLSDSPPI
jgi:hypothetical protein